MGRADDIRGIRDAVTVTSAVLESKQKRVKQGQGKRSPVVRESAPREQRFEWEEWIGDVNEAVEMFIGMGIDVLPRMPWRKWHESGLSAVVAAKNAAQMYEDSREEGSFDFSTDAKKPRGRISEQFPVGRDSYSEWTKKLSKRVEDMGMTLVRAMDIAGMDILQLHDMYNAEYDSIQVANAILKSANTKSVDPSNMANFESKKGSKLRKRAEALDEFAIKLGMRSRKAKEEIQEEVQEEEEEGPDDDPDEDADDNEGGDPDEDEAQTEETEEVENDNSASLIDEELGVAFAWPISEPSGYIGCFDLKTEKLLYSWGLRCGNCGKEVYENSMVDHLEAMRRDGRPGWVAKMNESNVKLPTGKPNLSNIDYHEEKGMIAQLGQAMGSLNAQASGHEEGSAPPDSDSGTE